MTHRAWPLALILAGCEAPDTRLPTISFSGGEVRLNTTARTPGEAYDFAYGDLGRDHQFVRRLMNAEGAKIYTGAADTLGGITGNLRAMRALMAEEADRRAVDPYLPRYLELAEEFRRQRIGANWETRLNAWEREVRSRFSPSRVKVVAEWPAGLGPAAPAPGPKPDPAAFRVAFKAWKASHAELVEAFAASRDASGPAADLMAALAQLKASAEPGRAGRLELMAQVYARQEQATKGWTAVPEGETKEHVLWELSQAARSIESEASESR